MDCGALTPGRHLVRVPCPPGDAPSGSARVNAPRAAARARARAPQPQKRRRRARIYRTAQPAVPTQRLSVPAAQVPADWRRRRPGSRKGAAISGTHPKGPRQACRDSGPRLSLFRSSVPAAGRWFPHGRAWGQGRTEGGKRSVRRRLVLRARSCRQGPGSPRAYHSHIPTIAFNIGAQRLRVNRRGPYDLCVIARLSPEIPLPQLPTISCGNAHTSSLPPHTLPRRALSSGTAVRYCRAFKAGSLSVDCGAVFRSASDFWRPAGAAH